MSFQPTAASAAPLATLAAPATANVATSAAACTFCALFARSAALPPSEADTRRDTLPTSAVAATKHRFHATPKVSWPPA